MKKIWIIVLSLVVVLCVAAACGKPKKDTGDAYNDADFTFEEYDYTNPEHTDSDWRDLDCDEGMTVDGSFSEESYAEQNEFTYTAGLNEAYSLTLSTYFGELGAYFKVAVKDPGVFYNKAQNIYENTSVILYIAPYRKGVAPVKGVNTIQLRVGANGQTEQWFGRNSADGYGYVRSYIPMMARTQILNEGGGAEAFDRLGEVNFSETGGYNVEIFMPYGSIGLSEKPENILVLPEFNKKMSFADTERTMYQAPGCDYLNPGTFKNFDANGFAKNLNQGAYMNGSLGYDLSNDTTEANRSIEQSGEGDQKLYFNDVNGVKYYIEADVTVKGILKNDSFPKFGLLAAENSANTFAFFVDPWAALSNKDVLAVDRTPDGKDWTWGSAKLASYTDMAYTDGNTVKLGVVRNGGKFYFIVNGVLVGTRENVRGFGAEDRSVAGFMTMNINGVYTAYNATTDSAEVDAVLSDTIYGVLTPPEKTSYRIDQSLDLTGGKLVFNNYLGTNRTEVALSDPAVTVTGFNSATAGVKKITATYEGKHYYFEVLVASITVDGDLADWEEEAAFNNSAEVIGTDTTVGKSVKFYAKLTNDGLYVAAIARHEVYKNTENDWFQNTNFEFFINGANQFYITEKARSANVSSGVMKTTDGGTAGVSRYTTVAEGFIAGEKIPAYVGGEIKVGFAWKTTGDKISGGAANNGGLDEYWVPKGSWIDNDDQLFVTENGIFASTQIVQNAITVDGDLSEWTEDMKRNPRAVFGNGNFTGQGFTVYAFYQPGTGLFAGVEAKHKTNPNTENDWFLNTNFEFYINGTVQRYINSRGQIAGIKSDYIKMVTLGEEGDYTTIVEFFLPQSEIRSAAGDSVRFGFAFKVQGESITIPDRDNGNATDWWWEDKHFPSNMGEQYFVRENGIFTE